MKSIIFFSFFFLITNSSIYFPSVLQLDSTNFEEFKKLCVDKQLDNFQISVLFHFIDQNHDDFISGFEWNQFHKLFILPFENCDMEHIYYIKQDGITNCVARTPQLEIIHNYLEKDPNLIEMFGNLLNEDKRKNGLNFLDYIRLRKQALAFKKCLSPVRNSISARDFCCLLDYISERFLEEGNLATCKHYFYIGNIKVLI